MNKVIITEEMLFRQGLCDCLTPIFLKLHGTVIILQ